ncbi:hypothetical protein DSO57_1028504 [Entomophthora muscae]|uniref:Uncharacterized protein n=1 Tax=Entomophthora muscae TaxID=34485 RepID=A0ACC2RSE1_9FUNG|nr:hypothetical protein DSO57_1028504 [Entomophthora muscae]
MKGANFIKLYRGIYHDKSKAIRNRVGLVCGLLFGLFAIDGVWNGKANPLSVILGIVSGVGFNYFLQEIIVQQLKFPKVSQLSILKSSSPAEEFGRILPYLKLYLASAATFLVATSSFSNPEYITPIVPLPDDEGYPRLHPDFIAAFLFIMFLACSRTFYYLLFQTNFALKELDEVTELTISISRALLHSFLMTGFSLVISILLSSFGYDILYGIWLCFQHILYTRAFALTNHFLGHLALSGVILNLCWIVVDELVLLSLVEHLDQKVVLDAGVNTLVSGLSNTDEKDYYVKVFCATELLHHIKTNSAFRRAIYGQSPSYDQVPLQSSWPFVSQSLTSILDSLTLDIKNLAATSSPKSNQSTDKAGSSFFSASALLDLARQFILKKLPLFWPHAHEQRLNLAQFWAHISLVLGTVISNASFEDSLGVVQWDIQQILKVQLELFDVLSRYLLTLRQLPGDADYEDVHYLLNALNKSCRMIVDVYQNNPENVFYVASDQIQRVNSLTYL